MFFARISNADSPAPASRGTAAMGLSIEAGAGFANLWDTRTANVPGRTGFRDNGWRGLSTNRKTGPEKKRAAIPKMG